MNYNTKAKDYINKEIETLKELDINKINEVVTILDSCLEKGNKVYVMGNGGSGSTASHMTNDFNMALFEKTDKTFNFTCLNDNIPIVLAIANDEGYEEIFRYQLINNLTKDDVVIALSGSGNSQNIINAVTYAKETGSLVIGFTGYDGGKLKQLANISIDTKINNMQITEDIHLIIEHMMISLFIDKYGKRKYKIKKKEIKE